MVRLAIVVFVSLGTALGPAGRRARAADPAEVEELIRQGVELRRQNRDPAAVPLFQKAYELDRSPRTAAQLALVESALGYWLAAERHLVEALASPQHPWLEQHLDEMKEALVNVRKHIGELEVLGAPDGAEVLLNGKGAGKLPLRQPIRVAEGPILVALRASGFVESSTTLTVPGGGHERVIIQLRPAPTESAPPASASAPVPPPELDLSAGREPPSWIRPAAWAAAAAAAAALAVGTYGVFEQRHQQRLFDAYTTPGSTDKPCAVLAARRGGSPCDSIYADATSAGHLAVAGFTGAAVLAAAAVVGFVVVPASEPQLSLRVAPDRAEVGWSLRF